MSACRRPSGLGRCPFDFSRSGPPHRAWRALLLPAWAELHCVGPQLPADTLNPPGMVRQPVVRVQRLLEGRAGGGAAASALGVAYPGWHAAAHSNSSQKAACCQHTGSLAGPSLLQPLLVLNSTQTHLRVHIQPKPCHPAGEERLAQGIIIQ